MDTPWNTAPLPPKEISDQLPFPQHTPDHENCPACEASRDTTLRNDPDSLLSKKFPAAGKCWLETRRPYLKGRTFEMYSHHLKTLSRFFGEISVEKIHLGHLRQYQLSRMTNLGQVWRAKAGPSLINHELSVVQQVLKRAGRWKHLAHHYEPLPLPAFQGKKVMTDDEEDRLFDIGASNPEFELPLMVAYLSVNTTACGSELRNVRLKHVNLTASPPWLLIDAKTAKNGERGRVIALNDTAVNAVEKCIKRAHSLGSVHPEHYLFPKRVTTGYWNPDKPASPAWLSKRWKAMREAAALPWLTPHCLRHQAITRLLEFGTPEETVRNIAGHVSAVMMRHYSHTRIAASAKALDAIDPRRRKQPQAERAKTRMTA
jgi:integrase